MGSADYTTPVLSSPLLFLGYHHRAALQLTMNLNCISKPHAFNLDNLNIMDVYEAYSRGMEFLCNQ